MAERGGRGGGALPKFGDWDVKNNPAGSEQGFTVIFNKARDDKKKTKVVRIITPPKTQPPSPPPPSTCNDNNDNYQRHHHPRKGSTAMQTKWLCCMVKPRDR